MKLLFLEMRKYYKYFMLLLFLGILLIEVNAQKLFPKAVSSQNTEWRKPDVTSQEHFLAGIMISYTGGYILEQGLNMRYGYELGLLAGGIAGYIKERSDPVFDCTDLSFTIVGSIAGILLNKGIQRWYGLSDYQIMKKKIKRLEKRAERLKRFTNPI